MNKLLQLIGKYDAVLPRYTSYPTANHFEEGFREEKFRSLIALSNTNEPEYLAFYIHIPFCRKICYYCGCNACVSKGENEIEAYIAALKKEIHLVKSLLGSHRKISQIHYGGGTPNILDLRHIAGINEALLSGLTMIENPEIAMECHPAWLDLSYLNQLMQLGFNRFSLGIQDFDPHVLKLVNRTPAALPPDKLLNFIRKMNPKVSVNLDFIYGLPGQTVAGFRETIQKALEVRPDRLVTFSYAHVPWMKKHQHKLEKAGLPDSTRKAEMFLTARDQILQAGYKPLGLDHYVLPEDELQVALQQKKLHRNFQGYCTRRTTGQVYAFGVSAISQLSGGYTQNTRSIEAYIQTLHENQFPVEKGQVVTREETIIRQAIHNILCNQYLDIEEVCSGFKLTRQEFDKITGFNPDKLAELQKDGLLDYSDPVLQVKDQGTLFLRNIAAVFDPALNQGKENYSRSI